MDTNKQQNYLAPFITMVILFFFVGFLTCINQQFQGPIKRCFWMTQPSEHKIHAGNDNHILVVPGISAYGKYRRQLGD